MKFLGYDSVMCLSAHPDDAEYGMLGTILKYTDTTFYMICLGWGGKFDDTSGGIRRHELDMVCSSVDNMQLGPVHLMLATPEDASESTLIHAVEVLGLKPQCVMITPLDDSHFEHRKIHDVGMAIARKDKIALIEYKTPSTLNTWTPNLYVDVAHNLPRKLALLKMFKSQVSNAYFDSANVMSFHVDYQCQKRGMSAVEAFKILGVYQ